MKRIKPIKTLLIGGLFIILVFLFYNLSAENSLYYFSLGEMALSNGNFAEADSLFQLAQKVDPGSIEILTERLIALYYQAKYKKIIDVGKQGLERKLVSQVVYGMIADSYEKLGDLKNSKKYLNKCLKISSGKGETYLHLYQLTLKEGKIKKAKKYLNKAEKVAGENADLLYRIAIEYGKQNNEKKFVETLQKVINIQPDFIRANIWLGDYYFTKKDFVSTIMYLKDLAQDSQLTLLSSVRELILSYYFTQNYTKVMDCENLMPADELDTDLRKIFFASSFRIKNYQRTIFYGKQILEKDADADGEMTDETLALMANAEFELQNYQDAFDCLAQIKQNKVLFRNLEITTSISYFLKDSNLLNRLMNSSLAQKNDTLSFTIQTITAYFYAKCDSLQSASKILEKINLNKVPLMESVGNDYIINLLSYTILKVNNDIDEAVTLLEKRKDKTVSITMWLGRFYANEKKYKTAIPYLQLAVEEDSTNIEIYFILGTVYDKLKNLKKEIALLEKGIKHFSDNAELLNWLGYTLVDNDMRLNYALKLLQKAIAIKPNDVYIWDSLAWAYYKLGENKKALESMKLVVEQDIQDTVIRYHLGNIFWKLGELESAKNNWHLAIKINNNEEAKINSENMLNRFGENVENNK